MDQHNFSFILTIFSGQYLEVGYKLLCWLLWLSTFFNGAYSQESVQRISALIGYLKQMKYCGLDGTSLLIAMLEVMII